MTQSEPLANLASLASSASAATVEQVPSGPDRLIVVGTYPGWSPAALFDYWVQPNRLREWWPPAAEVEPFAGGYYRMEWPRQNWTLRGYFTAFDPGHELAFTWRWDHDPPGVPETLVRVTFSAAGRPAATRLRVEHGPYPDSPEGSEWRQSHLDGWLHFLTRLGQLTPTR